MKDTNIKLTPIIILPLALLILIIGVTLLLAQPLPTVFHGQPYETRADRLERILGEASLSYAERQELKEARQLTSLVESLTDEISKLRGEVTRTKWVLWGFSCVTVVGVTTYILATRRL